MLSLLRRSRPNMPPTLVELTQTFDVATSIIFEDGARRNDVLHRLGGLTKGVTCNWSAGATMDGSCFPQLDGARVVCKAMNDCFLFVMSKAITNSSCVCHKCPTRGSDGKLLEQFVIAAFVLLVPCACFSFFVVAICIWLKSGETSAALQAIFTGLRRR